MIKTLTFFAFMPLSLFVSMTALAQDPEPTVEAQMQSLLDMCAQTSEARQARQAKSSLYERLGGYDEILKLTHEIVRLHGENEEIKHTLKGVDTDLLAKHVADFVAAGTGGTAEYTGRTLPASHAHLKLTDSHFLAAGSDIMTAMKNLGHGAEVTEEFVCILVSLKDQVVFSH